ncbi:MAG: ArnT family glycosyltransferase [Terrimicrobiaceae bacterium]
MIALIALAALIATAALLVAIFPLPSLPEKALAFLNYGIAQIIFVSVCLSDTFGISTISLLCGQLVLAVGTIAVWVWRERPPVVSFRELAGKFRGDGRKSAWFVLGLVVLVGWLIAGNTEFYRSFPSMNKDAISYHLPRAYYWLQQGSLNYLPVEDFRWKEFPPNSSVILMWMMAMGIGYEWMHLPQVIGAALIALGIYRLTVLCGGNRVTAACASVICIGFPAAIYQMGTSGNDLLVGGCVVSCVAFVAAALRPQADGPSVNRSSALTGIALGLAVGMKFTVLLFLPAMALFGFATPLVLGWKEWWARSRKILLACLLGFITLGSYGYIQNYRDHGSPLLSKPTLIKHAELPAELYSPLRTFVLSFYQSLSWHGLQSFPTERWPTLQREAIWKIDRMLKLGVGTLSSFRDDDNLTRIYTDENRAGFGVLGFFIMSAAPLVGLLWLVQFIRHREYRALLGGGLILIGFSTLVIFCINAPWGPTHIRYFVQFIPILVPPLACLIGGSGWIRYTVAIACAIFALWVMFFCIKLEPERKSLSAAVKEGKTPFDLHLGGRWVPQREVIRQAVPTGESIGYVGRVDSWAFVLPRELPEYNFVLLRSEAIDSALQSGRVAAVVTELFPTDLANALPLPGTILHPKQALHVADPGAALRRNLKAYGLTLDSDQRLLSLDSKAIAAFSNIHDLWPAPLRDNPLAGLEPDYDNHLQFWIPAGLLSGGNSALEVEIPLDSSFPEGIVSHITCNSKPVPFSINHQRLVVQIPEELRHGAPFLLDCRIFFTRDVAALVKGDEDFPAINPVYFGKPWTIRVAGE